MCARFLQTCKNPECKKQFGILLETIIKGTKKVKCPHCNSSNQINSILDKKAVISFLK